MKLVHGPQIKTPWDLSLSSSTNSHSLRYSLKSYWYLGAAAVRDTETSHASSQVVRRLMGTGFEKNIKWGINFKKGWLMNLLSPQLQSKFLEHKILKGNIIISSTVLSTHTENMLSFCAVTEQGQWDKKAPLPSPTYTRGFWDPVMVVSSLKNYAVQIIPP